MRAVWKYSLKVADEFCIGLPRGAEILSVQTQYDEPQLWCLVDTNEFTQELRYFRLAGTGHPIKDDQNLKFIETFQLFGGSFVGHLFEVL